MRTTRPSPSPSRVRQILVATSATLLISIVIGFHAVLLWQRVLDLSLFKPVPAIRWLATAFLIFGLWRLHQSGVSLVRGRRAVVFWLLILLLHLSFWGPLGEPLSTSSGWAGTGLLLALPAISVILGLAYPTIRRLLARVLRFSESRDRPRRHLSLDDQAFVVRAGFLPAVSCRPPPIASS